MTRHSHSKGGHPLLPGEGVSRIAESLVNASSEAPASDALVREAILARRLRYNFFSENLFGEPAWDMLLELLYAQIDGRQVTVSNLSEAAGVPATITIRWLNGLAAKGMIVQRRDPQDPTIELVELHPHTDMALRRYFHDVSNAR
jgi:DNA-binding MarR family transcriptional regulator